ncbi:MAG: 16S rRNA (adenine(1518)-N(6)/adenine(1519)-N(6))-dimethyltransferase, partial [Acidobacteriota bacterium]|nr:16S rRNA (adenine(1518)-N(6)/adenine(1519)-N(6))-dimethyltransferase [Acidobacteriota bacterium]
LSTAFSQKRKTILNNLKNAPQELKEKIGDVENFLRICEIDSKRRAETLTLPEWLKIFQFYNSV